MSELSFASKKQADEHGTKAGEWDGTVLFHENVGGYRDRNHAVSGLDECASEAASVLGVPKEFYPVWITSYANAARATIQKLWDRQ